MSTQQILIGIVALVVIAGGAFLFLSSQQSSDSMMKDDGSEAMQKDDATMPADAEAMADKEEKTMTEDSGDAMMSKGSYEPYSPEKLALASDGKVVLYFHADWCPICRGIEAEIKANPAGIPSDVTILKVNYDTETTLKQKYGVTYQHTFVQVDAAGKQITKWGDATTLAHVIARIK